MFLPNAVQLGLIMAGFSATPASAMDKPITFSDQMIIARESFTEFLDSNESKLKVANWVPNYITTASSKAMGYGNVTAEERIFVNRFFENKEKKQGAIKDFLQNPEKYKAHLFTIFNQYQARQKRESQIDPINLLIDVMHRETITQLKQDPKTTRAEMAQIVLAKNNTQAYLIPDEDYLRVALVNFFAMHMFERFFRG